MPVIVRTLRGWLVVGTGVVVVAAIFWATYLVAERLSIRALREMTSHRMDIYSASLQAEMNRFEYLPHVVALKDQVVQRHHMRRHATPSTLTCRPSTPVQALRRCT